MNLETALGAMKLISQMGRGGYLEQVGISKGDFERVISDIPWLGNERGRISTALYSLIVGSVDAQALPRLSSLPAEYLAAGISMFVHPTNAYAACHYMGSAPSNEEMSRTGDRQNINKTNHVLPEQIFALVVDLYRTEGRAVCRDAFMRATNLQLEKAQKEVKK